MTPGFRIFSIFYALAMAAVAIGIIVFSRSRNASLPFAWIWFSAVSPMMSYIALAVGYMLSGERENAPSRFWLGLTFALVLSCSFLWPWADPLESHLSPLSLLPLLLSITFLAATAFVLSQLRGERCERFNRVRGITLPLSLMVGGGLVLASLFLTVTLKDGTGTGWSVVTRQTQWVTYYASMGQGAFFGPTIDWLQPVFAPVGYVLYLLGTAGMLAMILLLVKSRFTVEKMQASGLFKWLSTLIIFVSLWLFTDVFWGWHFVDLPYVPWAAAVALGCWLLMLAFGAILLAEWRMGRPRRGVSAPCLSSRCRWPGSTC